MPSPKSPRDKSSEGARVINLGEYRQQREAPLQAAKDRHPAYLAMKRKQDAQDKTDEK